MKKPPSQSVIDFYETRAETWDTNRGKELLEKTWLDRFLAMVPAQGHILDLGCGSGEPIASYFIGQGYKVTGVDSSPSLIALCQKRFPQETWLVSDMRQLQTGQLYDGIIAWDSFFHLTHDDQKIMFDIFRQHTRPGAPLLFTAGPHHGEAINPLWGEDLYHASFAYEEYAALLQDHGFTIVTHKLEDPACGGHSVYMAKNTL